jgi:hypothetical protein
LVYLFLRYGILNDKSFNRRPTTTLLYSYSRLSSKKGITKMTEETKLAYYKSLIGKKIRIIDMSGEWHYTGKEGVVKSISGGGVIPHQLHGTWGGLAVIPGTDTYEVIE